MELSDIEHSFDAVSDLMLEEPFVSLCSQELALFVKECVPSTIEETSKLSEQYDEVHGVTLVANKSTRVIPTTVNRPLQSTNMQP